MMMMRAHSNALHFDDWTWKNISNSRRSMGHPNQRRGEFLPAEKQAAVQHAANWQIKSLSRTSATCVNRCGGLRASPSETTPGSYLTQGCQPLRDRELASRLGFPTWWPEAAPGEG